MAEAQSRHRRELEAHATREELRHQRLGILIGALVALVGLGAGTAVAIEANPWAGALIMGGELVALVSVFVYASERRRSERVEKARIMGEPAPDDSSRRR